MKTCTRCVLPENYPSIQFDEKGVCNYCRSHKKWTYRGREALDDYLKAVRGRGKKFDCVAGVSGGRDSSYALHFLVKECNLRVVAFTSDSGFIPQAAKDNIKKMTDILGVELVVYEYNVLKRCARQDLRAWLRRPAPAMIPMICSGCKLATSREVLRYAKRNHIPLVVMNIDTPVEIGILKNKLLATNPFGRLIKSKGLALLFGLFYELFKNPSYLSPYNAYVFVLEYLYFFQFQRMRKLFYPNQTTLLDLYRYIEWDEERILSTITGELGWRTASDSPSTWRFDCQLSYLKNYLFIETISVTEKHDGMSAMVREGMISREIALQRLQAENYIPPNAIEDALESIGLSDTEKRRFSNQVSRLKAG